MCLCSCVNKVSYIKAKAREGKAIAKNFHTEAKAKDYITNYSIIKASLWNPFQFLICLQESTAATN